ncbi:MAG TPA: LppX_LprAFG lipoprotein [Gaiellaceae bacterium]|nr:LppX_LprAFG lipoprotein [Gaiellaceae bacterium]
MSARQAASVLALLWLAVGLSACGVSRTIDPVAAAATKTEQAGGSKISMTVDVSSPAGQSYEVTANGAFDQQEGQMTMDMSNLLQSSGLPVGSGSGVEVRYLTENRDPVMYMDMPFLASKLPAGKDWLRLDLEKAGKSMGIDFSQLMGQSSQNPAQTLDMLRASGNITEVGPDTVNGEPTTEYTGSVDLAKAAKLRGLPQSLVQKMEDTTGSSTIPVTVWVGSDGLVRQVVESIDTTSGGQTLTTKVTIDISDYGTDVSVSAPPSDEVLDLTDLASSALQQTTTTSKA